MVENIKLNPKLKSKIIPFNIGLSDATIIEKLYSFENRDDLSTTSKEFIEFIVKDTKNIETNYVPVCQASNIIESITALNNNTSILLKVDTEGSEYPIFKDLFKNYKNFFNKVSYICGETHLTNELDHIQCFNYIKDNLPTFSIIKQDINNKECVNNFILKNTQL